jgi:hypothetical protein
MRRRTVVAAAALIAAFALAGLPVPAESRQPAEARDLAPAAFTLVTVPADVPALSAWDGFGAGREQASMNTDPETPYVEAGSPPGGPAARPPVALPGVEPGSAWREPLQLLTGWASFYDAGTTAMRLPRGTLVRICGEGGCIVRTVTDYGPADRNGRIVDLYRPDFFRVCGCASWSGTTKVTVSVY